MRRLGVEPGLVRLALRRCASPLALGAFLLLAALVLWTAPAARDASWTGIEPGRATRALGRESAWAVGLLLFVPWLVARAALFAARDWTRERDLWLARAPRRWTIALSTWLGCALAALVYLALLALLCETRGTSAPSFVRSGRLRGLERIALEQDRVQMWRLDDPGPRAPAGTRLSVPFSLAGGASTAELELTAHRVRDGRAHGRTSAVSRIGGRERVELELPPGPGDLVFSCVRRGAGLVALRSDRGLELWEPAASERAASARVLLVALVLCAAATALALLFGSVVSPGAALALLASAWIACATSGAPPAYVPGVQLADALAVLGRGRVPEGPGGAALVGLAVGAAAGLVGAAALLGRFDGGREA